MTPSPWIYVTCSHCNTRKAVRVLSGAWVRKRREKQGETLRSLARRLDISASYLSDIERGNRTLRADGTETAYDIIYALGGSPA